MKKFVLIGLIIVLSKLSFVYADSAQLKKLAGKMIYRNVPAQNETEFSKEYMNEYYELFSYNKSLMELKDSSKKSITLARSLWDDGNWKTQETFYFTNSALSKNNDINHNCSHVYNQKHNLNRGDHVAWDGKCGHILIFDISLIDRKEIATVAYCRGKSSLFYCTARDEVEYIGTNNLTKNNKCFKYP